jgi:hypothetical protein
LSTLGLAPATLQAVKDLLVEREQAKWDVYNSLSLRGPLPNNYYSLVQEQQAPVDEELKKLVDSQTYAAIQTMIYGEQTYVDIQNSIGLDFEYENCPLTANQLVALGNAIADARKKEAAMNRTVGNTVDPISGIPFSTKALLDAAPSILTPEQLEVLRESMAGQSKPSKFVQASS